jgi:hypothetical protein
VALDKEIFFKKNLCRVPSSLALGKAGKFAKIGLLFPALPSVFVIAIGKGFLYRVLHSAKCPIFLNFYIPSRQK